jgi:glutamine cyclotransferase
MKRLFHISLTLALAGALLVSCTSKSDTPQVVTATGTPSRVPTSPSPTRPSILVTSTPVTISPLPFSPLPDPTRDAVLDSPLPPAVSNPAQSASIPVYTYRVVNTFPHDPDAFTQGLIFEDGWLYESTGLIGRSTMRRVELETGNVLQLYALDPQLFGEGLTMMGDMLYQLTWQARVGFVYDKESFELLQEFNYPTEGWGLTHDGERLIMSDGTGTLYFLDPETLEETGQLEVLVDDKAATRSSIPDLCFPFGERTHVYVEPEIGLNELEYVRGEIYANVWATDCIAKVDPQTGHVTGWIELVGLLVQTDFTRSVDVLNGIAYDAEQDRLFVTGKLWPKLFEIEVIDTED